MLLQRLKLWPFPKTWLVRLSTLSLSGYIVENIVLVVIRQACLAYHPLFATLKEDELTLERYMLHSMVAQP